MNRAFSAKSICYSPRFWGWPWGPGVFRAENQLPPTREVWDRLSVVDLIYLVHLGRQTGEMARMGHFWAKSVCYSPQF